LLFQQAKTLLDLEEIIGYRQAGKGYSTFDGFKGIIRVSPKMFQKCRGGQSAIDFLQKCAAVGDDTGGFMLINVGSQRLHLHSYHALTA
jgi:hypothetical protein